MFDNLKKRHCSFCGKSAQEVKKLVAGPAGVHICGACVDICQAVTQGGDTGVNLAFDPKTWPKERLLPLLKPVSNAVDAQREHLQTIVDALRAQDVSWAEIGKQLGVSRQTVWERFS